MSEWEDVAIPAGSFIGWGTKPGQHVTGRVVEYNLDGGSDFAGGKCPLLAIELTEKAASFNKEGARTDIEAGQMVQITCGQVKLKAGVRAANPNPGDLMKIELTNVVKTNSGNTMKDFGIKIARGAGVANANANNTTPASAVDDDEPPF